MKRWAGGLAAVVLLAAPAYGQSGSMSQQTIENVTRRALDTLSGTLSVYYEPMMSGGSLSGCTFVFEHFMQENKYLGGDFLRTSGSVGLMSNGGTAVGVVVKVLAVGVKPDLSKQPTMFPLGRAYLVSSDLQSNLNALVDTYETEQQGGVLSVYHLEQSTMQLFDLIETGIVTIAVAPPGGGMDILLPIDLTVVSTNDDGTRVRSEDSLRKFMPCLEVLMSQE